MSDKEYLQQLSVGFASLLALSFITLKLTGHIDWHWAWVLCPLWGVFALVGAILLIGFSLLPFAMLWDATVGSIVMSRRRKRLLADLHARRRDGDA